MIQLVYSPFILRIFAMADATVFMNQVPGTYVHVVVVKHVRVGFCLHYLNSLKRVRGDKKFLRPPAH